MVIHLAFVPLAVKLSVTFYGLYSSMNFIFSKVIGLGRSTAPEGLLLC